MNKEVEPKRMLGAADFEKQLATQMGYLRRSCAAFDDGHHDEAPRIATTIRVLVHDNGRRSVSLLTHLGIKEDLRFVGTGVSRAEYEAEILRQNPGMRIVSRSPGDVGLVEVGQVGAGPLGWYAPLVTQRFQPGTPPYLATKGTSAFAVWWTTPVVEGTSERAFSREELVRTMADQDGGALVDAAINARYADLCIDTMGGGMISTRPIALDEPVPQYINNVAFASVRQIAFELLLTLERRAALKNPGSLLRADPYSDIAKPKRPHRPVFIPKAIIFKSTTPEGDLSSPDDV